MKKIFHLRKNAKQKETRETYIKLMNGRITVPRCQALSKRSNKQCKKEASNGKTVCMFHGGRSTGPITSLGKQRCAMARTIHGRETRAKRKKSERKKFKEMQHYFSILKRYH